MFTTPFGYRSGLGPPSASKKPTQDKPSWNFFTNLTTEIRNPHGIIGIPYLFFEKKGVATVFLGEGGRKCHHLVHHLNCGKLKMIHKSLPIHVQDSCAKEAAVKDGAANRLVTFRSRLTGGNRAFPGDKKNGF